MIDIADLRRLHAATEIASFESCHIVSSGYTHMANLCSKDKEGIFTTACILMLRREVSDYFAVAHNTMPELLDELNSARKRIAELESSVASFTRGLV